MANHVHDQQYENALHKMREKTRGREPTDPAARARFDREQELCARTSARLNEGFPEYVYEDEEAEPAECAPAPAKPPSFYKSEDERCRAILQDMIDKGIIKTKKRVE